MGLLLVVALLVSHGDSVALTGSLTNDPSDVVRRYVSLDSRGARLQALAWEALRPYIDWTEEPLWGYAVVIDDYEVVDDVRQWEIIDMLEAVVPVRFRVLGIMYWDTASFLPEPRTQEIGFRVKAVDDRWRIVEPIIPPHVGRQRLVNYVRQAILEETNVDRLARLKALRDELRNAQ